MCGRFLYEDVADLPQLQLINDYIEQRFGPERATQLKTGEIFPSNEVPVLVTAEADPLKKKPDSIPASFSAASLQRELTGGSHLIALPMTWGFPGFRGSRLLINARQETISEKPTFSESYAERRCVIPTTGFIEWSHDDKGRASEKFRFNVPGTDLLFLAGIFTFFGQELRFVILTTAANASMAAIHHRQPVVIPAQMIRPWISDFVTADELRQSPGPHMLQTLLQ